MYLILKENQSRKNECLMDPNVSVNSRVDSRPTRSTYESACRSYAKTNSLWRNHWASSSWRTCGPCCSGFCFRVPAQNENNYCTVIYASGRYNQLLPYKGIILYRYLGISFGDKNNNTNTREQRVIGDGAFEGRYILRTLGNLC